MNFIINLVLYPYTVMISLGQTDEELIPLLKGFISEEVFNADTEEEWKMLEDNNGKLIWYSGCKLVLRLTDKPNSAAEYGTLAHEVFHIAEHVMREVGCKLTVESQEAYAYLIGYITKTIFEHLIQDQEKTISLVSH